MDCVWLIWWSNTRAMKSCRNSTRHSKISMPYANLILVPSDSNTTCFVCPFIDPLSHWCSGNWRTMQVWILFIDWLIDWLISCLSNDWFIIYVLFTWFFNHNFFTFQPRQLLSMSRCWAWKSPAHCRVAGGQSPRPSASTRSWPNSTLSSAWSPKTTPWTPPSLVKFSSSFSIAFPPTLSIFWCRARKHALLSWEFKFGKKLRVNAALDRLIIYASSSHSNDRLLDWLFLAYCAHLSDRLIDWLLDLRMSLLYALIEWFLCYSLIHLSMLHVWSWSVYCFIFRLSLWLTADFCNFVFIIYCRANISQIHDFVRTHSASFQGDDIMQAMGAITECAHILQARKTREEDIDGLINMSRYLSNAQVSLLDSFIHWLSDWSIVWIDRFTGLCCYYQVP